MGEQTGRQVLHDNIKEQTNAVWLFVILLIFIMLNKLVNDWFGQVAAGMFPLVLLCLLVSGCCHCRHLPVQVQRDSVVIYVRDSVYYRDTVIQWAIPEESDASEKADASDTSHLETSLAESDAWVEDGVLHHSLRNKQGQIVPINITMRYRVHEMKTEGLRERIIEKTVEKELSWWQVFFIRLGQITASAVLIWLILRIVKRYIKL